MKTSCKPYLFAFLATSIVGTALHFLYSSTKFFPFAFISPMNESVWEHVKLSVIPLLIAYCILYFVLKPDTIRFVSAACASILCSVIMIISLHYTLACGLSVEGVAWDILLYYFAMAVSLYLSCRAMSFDFKRCESLLLVICTIALLVMLIVFTVAPPNAPMFIDTSD